MTGTAGALARNEREARKIATVRAFQKPAGRALEMRAREPALPVFRFVFTYGANSV